ncbi:MAG: DUF362 domain-containing protein [Kiritimatiellales bacterium]|nr:DUF362 domain-containing protein [Kiritimatiellales bacterium]
MKTDPGKNPFKICPKSGKFVGFNSKSRLFRWLFPAFGLLSLVWYLIRVLPKPSRATYPCQRVAGPLAWSFLGYLLSWGILFASFKKARHLLNRSRYVTAGCCTAVGLIALVWSLDGFSLLAYAFTPADSPNTPVGTAKGIYPGRVAWIRNPAATTYDGSSGRWWDDNGTDQTAVDCMLSRTLQRLTGETTDSSAWEALFSYFNTTKGLGSSGYAASEKIAVKINCNNAGSHGDTDNQIDASPHTVLAMLRQLVNEAGVPQANIVVYEAKKVIPDRIYTKCHAEFPDVRWGEPSSGSGRIGAVWQTAISYARSNDCGTDIPDYVAEAKYIVNMGLLKVHSIAGVTLTAKNHYGSIDGQDHTYIDSDRAIGGFNPLVDLIGSQELGGKTVLFMIDGLYGVSNLKADVSNSSQSKWSLFGEEYSASIFLSLDPVAIDSVGLDFLNAEWGSMIGRGADNYLHEAAQADDPPSEYAYEPDGVPLQSLGVHEHWNNSTAKQYTRNLGTGSGIELYQVALDTDSDNDGMSDQWEIDYFGGTNVANGGPQDDFDNDGISNLSEFALGGIPNDAGDISSILPSCGIKWADGAMWFEYTYNRRRNAEVFGLNYYLEVTSNPVLGEWVNDGYDEINVEIISADFESVHNRVSTVNQPNQCIRLQIEHIQ